MIETKLVLVERLYAQLPFAKIKVRNPYQDWAAAMRQMRDFLGLPQSGGL